MTYDRTVEAALAETRSKFALAEALALDIPPMRGKSSDTRVRVAEARQKIIDAGGEPRAVDTLMEYRDTARWVMKPSSGKFRWVDGVSFSAHREASDCGLSYDEFTQLPKKTLDTVRAAKGRGPARRPQVIESWSPDEKAAVAKELMNDEQVAAAVVSDPRSSGRVMEALDRRYEQSARPVKPREPEPESKQLQLVWEFRKLHVGMKDILDLASDPDAVVSETQREAVLAEIKWLRNALDLIESGLTSQPLYEAVAEFLANQES